MREKLPSFVVYYSTCVSMWINKSSPYVILWIHIFYEYNMFINYGDLIYELFCLRFLDHTVQYTILYIFLLHFILDSVHNKGNFSRYFLWAFMKFVNDVEKI